MLKRKDDLLLIITIALILASTVFWVLNNYVCSAFTCSTQSRDGEILFISSIQYTVLLGSLIPSDSYVNQCVRIFNKMGRAWTGMEFLHEFSPTKNPEFPDILFENGIVARLRRDYKDIQEKSSINRSSSTGMGDETQGIKIRVATIACDQSRYQVMAMIKSAVMFSQDANLHITVISDEEMILELGEDIMVLKWTVNALGWDFTFDLRLDSFPIGTKVQWRMMWGPCATQRLFFPSLLHDVDSVIYLDADTIVISNLTDLWLQFELMGETKFAGMTANTERGTPGWYDLMSQVPFYGSKGLNAGIMLMNLTRLREFNFEQKAVSIYKVFKDKIELADQDILNILFYAFPDKMLLLDCSFNFIWAHCRFQSLHYRCHFDTLGDAWCFCNATFGNGVQILHGNMGTFKKFPFMQQLQTAIEDHDLLNGSYKELFMGLKKDFDSQYRPCDPLTSDMLYRNAEHYFKRLNKF